MPGSDGQEFLVIFEKAVSWDPKLGEASWDLKLDEASPVCGLRDAHSFVRSDGTVSIVRIVSLSLLVSKD